MRPVGTDRGHTYRCAPVQLKMINFSDAQFESLTYLSDQRPYYRALLFERMHIAKQEVELQRAHPHGHADSLGKPAGLIIGQLLG
jgi:hypothetical protein